MASSEVIFPKAIEIFNKKLKFFTSAIVAGTPAIAAGVAKALKMKKSKNRVWCFIGDGALDEGNFYEAYRYSCSQKLPIVFVIEDNNRSVDSTKENRSQGEFEWKEKCVIKYDYKITYPHAGTGSGKWIKFKY